MKATSYAVIGFSIVLATSNAETVVGEDCSKIIVSQSTQFDVSTQTLAGYPEGLPSPIFWIDCTRTNNWVFAPGSGRVVKIPSLVGERYLTTEKEDGHFNAWILTGADYVAAGDLNFSKVLDFGELHIGKSVAPGLMFNACSSTEGAAPSNTLCNIGSVAAVLGSHMSGGYLLGGGPGGIAFLRGNNGPESDITTLGRASLMGKSPGSSYFYNGMVYLDGLLNVVNRTTYNGAWHTLVFNPTEASRLYATGIGMNDCRESWAANYVHGGGQKIAEMIIFSEKLTDEQSRLLNVYFASKWRGVSPCGWNGRSALSEIKTFANASAQAAATRIGFNVDEGQCLTVGRVRGGRAATTTPGIDKNGSGTLLLDDLGEYGGDVRLKGGTLSFNRRAVPHSLPPRRLAHFDASDLSSLVLEKIDGTNFVKAWRGDASSVWKDKILWLVPAQGCKKAFLREGAFGGNMCAVDLGALGPGSAAFSFAADETGASSVTFSGVSTIVAVVGAQEGGGHLGDNYFKRNVSSPVFSDSLVETKKQGSYFYLDKEGVVYFDGVKRDISNGYPHRGYHVVALQLPAFNLSSLGRNASSNFQAGGLRISEIAIYNRLLDEDELKDASAYLMAKWFGRTPPGYAKPEGDDSADVQCLEIHNAGTAIDVPDGSEVRVAKLHATCPFEKRGGGTLVVPSLRNAGDEILVKSGKVEARPMSTVASESAMAVSAAFHLDASDPGRMDVDSEGRVAFWYDSAMRNYAFQTNAAWRASVRANALNGLAMVDFGASSTSGCYMNFERSLDSVRSVFMVVGTQDDTDRSASILGSSRHCPDVGASTVISSLYDFARQKPKIFHAGYAQISHVVNGDILTNGVRVSSSVPLNGDYQLVEVHTLAGAHASAIACDRVGQVTQSRGGLRVGEVILYTRELSERERIATRNYLRLKWFPDEDVQELPQDAQSAIDRPEGVSSYLAQLSVDAETELEVDRDETVKRLSGAGTIVKRGAATLAVADLSGYSGRIKVEEGVLALSGESLPEGSGKAVEDGRIFHVDANRLVETCEGSGTERRVSKWTSLHDPSWAAVAGFEGKNPTLRAYAGKSGLFAVDMDKDAGECLRFVRDGECAYLDRIRSAFWVIGSQNGGGYLLGGGTNAQSKSTYYNFHRQLPRENTYERKTFFNPTNPVLSAASSHAQLRNNAAWRMNGKDIDPTRKGLSGDWDQLSMVMDGEEHYTSACGFAFDGRTFEEVSTMHETLRPVIGAQRLGEVILYDRVLSAEEVAQNEAYLRRKWSIGVHESTLNEAVVEVGAGGMLDCADSLQHVGTLMGAGAVRGGISPQKFVADVGGTLRMEVSGTFAVPGRMTVQVLNLPQMDGGTTFKLLRADRFEGVENLSAAAIDAEGLPGGYLARLVINAEGWLCLRASPAGTKIIVK